MQELELTVRGFGEAMGALATVALIYRQDAVERMASARSSTSSSTSPAIGPRHVYGGRSRIAMWSRYSMPTIGSNPGSAPNRGAPIQNGGSSKACGTTIAHSGALGSMP